MYAERFVKDRLYNKQVAIQPPPYALHKVKLNRKPEYVPVERRIETHAKVDKPATKKNFSPKHRSYSIDTKPSMVIPAKQIQLLNNPTAPAKAEETLQAQFKPLQQQNTKTRSRPAGDDDGTRLERSVSNEANNQTLRPIKLGGEDIRLNYTKPLQVQDSPPKNSPSRKRKSQEVRSRGMYPEYPSLDIHTHRQPGLFKTFEDKPVVHSSKPQKSEALVAAYQPPVLSTKASKPAPEEPTVLVITKDNFKPVHQEDSKDSMFVNLSKDTGNPRKPKPLQPTLLPSLTVPNNSALVRQQQPPPQSPQLNREDLKEIIQTAIQDYENRSRSQAKPANRLPKNLDSRETVALPVQPREKYQVPPKLIQKSILVEKYYYVVPKECKKVNPKTIVKQIECFYHRRVEKSVYERSKESLKSVHSHQKSKAATEPMAARKEIVPSLSESAVIRGESVPAKERIQPSQQTSNQDMAKSQVSRAEDTKTVVTESYTKVGDKYIRTKKEISHEPRNGSSSPEGRLDQHSQEISLAGTPSMTKDVKRGLEGSRVQEHDTKMKVDLL